MASLYSETDVLEDYTSQSFDSAGVTDGRWRVLEAEQSSPTPSILNTPCDADAHTVVDGTVDGDAPPTSDNVTGFSGGCFEEQQTSSQYAPSVTTNCSLPLLTQREPFSATGAFSDRGCQSDNGESMGRHASQIQVNGCPNPNTRQARSASPAFHPVHRWKKQQEDWKDHPARSVAHSKRRHKHRVQRSLNKINATLFKTTDKNENGAHEEM